MTEMNKSTIIQRLFQSAEPYLKKRGDVLHTQVAHKYALILMKEEGGNREIIEPAIILHDVGWSSLTLQQLKVAYGVKAAGKEADRLNRRHEREGAVIAGQILQALKYAPLLTEKICMIIRRHDSGKKNHSLEEKIVKDADKLWRFSKIGFSEEVDRQALKPNELSQYLFERYTKWFFTDTALMIAGKEIKNRIAETT